MLVTAMRLISMTMPAPSMSEYLHNLALACAGVSYAKGNYGVVVKRLFDFRAKIHYSGKKQEAVLLRIPICRLADTRKAGVAHLVEEALIACAAVTRTNTILTPWTAIKPDPKADSFLKAAFSSLDAPDMPKAGARQQDCEEEEKTAAVCTLHPAGAPRLSANSISTLS